MWLSFIQIYVVVIHSALSYLRVIIMQIDKIFQVAEIVSEIDYSCTFIKRKIVNTQCGLFKLVFSFRKFILTNSPNGLGVMLTNGFSRAPSVLK